MDTPRKGLRPSRVVLLLVSLLACIQCSYQDTALGPEVKLRSKTQAERPGKRSRTRIGVGEAVFITASQEVDWKLSGDGDLSTSHGTQTKFTVDDRASRPTVIASAGEHTASITFEVVEPQGEEIVGQEELDYYKPECFGAGMRITTKLMPDDVSFEGTVQLLEIEGPPTNIRGYFEEYVKSRHDRRPLDHQPTKAWMDLKKGNTIVDTVELVGPPPPWSDGMYEWEIPVQWQVAAKKRPKSLPGPSRIQRFELEAATRTATITKFGVRVRRPAPRAVETWDVQEKCQDDAAERYRSDPRNAQPAGVVPVR